MADLIDRQAAVEAYCSYCGLNFPLCDMRRSGKHRYGICAVPALWELPTAQPEPIRPKARDIYYEETDHCEFKCSLCHATIGVVEGGTLDGAWFRFCPNCGAEMEDWCERPD